MFVFFYQPGSLNSKHPEDSHQPPQKTDMYENFPSYWKKPLLRLLTPHVWERETDTWDGLGGLLVQCRQDAEFQQRGWMWAALSNKTTISPCKRISMGHVWLTVSALKTGGTWSFFWEEKSLGLIHVHNSKYFRWWVGSLWGFLIHQWERLYMGPLPVSNHSRHESE